MAKYRKKPVVVDAELWDGTDAEAERLGLHWHGGRLVGITRGWFVKTIEDADVHCKPPVWIITGILGEKYPCYVDIFEQTYELVTG